MLGLMRRLLLSEARKEFSDTVHRAYYGDEITVITKRGRDLAAIVPMKLVQRTGRPESRGKPSRSLSRSAN